MDNNKRLTIIAEDLCEYALEREDIKWIADTVPESAGHSQSKLEYELQLLKIITVGWGISFWLEKDPAKEETAGTFWKNVSEVSGGLSQATSLFIGKDVDYFNELKTRLDRYVLAVSTVKGDNPAIAIGPEFAGHFGNPEDLFASMAGSKMFMAAFAGVKQYLQAAGFKV
jgi:hypothetical protein